MKCLYTTTLRFAKRFGRNAAAPVIIRPRLGGRARTDRSAVTQTRKCDLPSTSNVIKVLHLLHFACSPSFSPPLFLSVLANICHNPHAFLLAPPSRGCLPVKMPPHTNTSSFLKRKEKKKSNKEHSDVATLELLLAAAAAAAHLQETLVARLTGRHRRSTGRVSQPRH